MFSLNICIASLLLSSLPSIALFSMRRLAILVTIFKFQPLFSTFLISYTPSLFFGFTFSPQCLYYIRYTSYLLIIDKLHEGRDFC